MKLFTVIKNIWSIKELRQRILFTLALLLVYRIGTFVVLPGVVPAALEKSASNRSPNDLLGLINVFTGGAFAKIPLGGARLSLRPELLFTTKGAQFDQIGGNTSDLKLSYLEIPLSLEFNLAIINLHAGVHAGLLATAEGTFKDSQGNPITFDIDKDDLQSFDYGWHLGGGIDLGNIGLHLRVSRSLQDISNENTFEEFFGSLKNASWALTASYGF